MTHGLSNGYLYTAQRTIATWNTPDGVRVVSGTGFLVKQDEDIYLITNRHVAELSYKRPKYPVATLISLVLEGYEDLDENNMPSQYGKVEITNPDKFIFHPNEYNDIACLKNPQCASTKNISASIGYEMLASKEKLDAKLVVCDKIAYPGFPEWFDKKNHTPIFRTGTIASDPRFGYARDVSAPDADIIAYEGFSSNGASGSPVFALQKGFRTGPGISAPEDFYREVMVVGINAGHYSGDEGHSGISYFYKSSAILELIDSCK